LDAECEDLRDADLREAEEAFLELERLLLDDDDIFVSISIYLFIIT
jgi:hypothetical protein